MNGEQIRAARAALKMEQSAFAKMCGLSVETIKRFEKVDGPIRATIDTLQKVYLALDEAGITLIDDESEFGQGCGVFVSARKPEKIHLAILDAMDRFKVAVLFELHQRVPDLFDRPTDEIIDIFVNEIAASKDILKTEVEKRMEDAEKVRRQLRHQTPDRFT